jgi:hypothetical protein
MNHVRISTTHVHAALHVANHALTAIASLISADLAENFLAKDHDRRPRIDRCTAVTRAGRVSIER